MRGTLLSDRAIRPAAGRRRPHGLGRVPPSPPGRALVERAVVARAAALPDDCPRLLVFRRGVQPRLGRRAHRRLAHHYVHVLLARLVFYVPLEVPLECFHGDTTHRGHKLLTLVYVANPW